jgi:FkbM family methyltransferase
MLRSLGRTLYFLMQHPVHSRRPWRGLVAFARWQLAKRIGVPPVPKTLAFVNDSRLHVDLRHSDTVGVIYVGLTEFWDQGFVLHFVRAGDRFVDVGANIGTYAIAVAAATDAEIVAFEPVPSTYDALVANIALNHYGGRISAHRVAVDAAAGTVAMTIGLDTANHIVADRPHDDSTAVPTEAAPLDALLRGAPPTLLKIDVEGFESRVLDGARDTLADPRLLAIVIELNGSGAQYGIDDDAIHRRIIAAGFHSVRYSALDRTLTSLDDGRSPLGNTIYVRDLDAARARLEQARPFRVFGGEF